MTKWQLDDLYKRSLDCLEGRTGAQDLPRAFALNAAAARAGHAEAALAMGWFYLYGVGVLQDVEQARNWYRESARRGEPRAMFSLGQIACDEQDFQEAHAWFKRAAEAGYELALYWRGKLFWRGQGVRRDEKTARTLFEQAAEKKVKVAGRALRFLSRPKSSKKFRPHPAWPFR
jgi:uncharacterized protein